MWVEFGVLVFFCWILNVNCIFEKFRLFLLLLLIISDVFCRYCFIDILIFDFLMCCVDCGNESYVYLFEVWVFFLDVILYIGGVCMVVGVVIVFEVVVDMLE